MERGTGRSAEPRGSPQREGARYREPIGKNRKKKKFFLRNAVVLLLVSPKAVIA